VNSSVKPVIQMSMLLKSSRAIDARISVAEHIRAQKYANFSRKSFLIMLLSRERGRVDAPRGHDACANNATGVNEISIVLCGHASYNKEEGSEILSRHTGGGGQRGEDSSRGIQNRAGVRRPESTFIGRTRLVAAEANQDKVLLLDLVPSSEP